MNKLIVRFIMVAMVLGIVLGAMLHHSITDQAVLTEVTGYLSIGTDIFMRLIKMVIGPLVFATLVPGLARIGDAGDIGRVGAKAMLWFISASFISLLLGLVMANLLQPGAGLNLPLPAVDAQSGLNTAVFSLKDFITHLVPRSIAESMAQNEVLQIVVFSIFCGIALSAIGPKGEPLVAVVESIGHMMLKITEFVMWLAPIAVFTAIANIIAIKGLGIVVTFAKFIGCFYLGIVTLWLILIFAGYLVLGRDIFKLIRSVKGPFLLSFFTASSEASFPQLLVCLDKFGVKRKISGFVLPLGYSFNLDGTMVYCTFTVLFIAQAYGIDMSITTQIGMLLMLMITSKGIAGVPRASLIVIAATLTHFGLPEEGILLVMAIDTFLDMGRSATNSVGNSIACAVVAKWEGALDRQIDRDGAPDEFVQPELTKATGRSPEAV
ncbi:Na+/H+ dicarboxylate symporter [Pseudomonas sp. GM84]|uniref:dicarboxylate/amino acid:cation symporter n=1 Tax=Pseudomonas sp. GM84 TaxID=1144340 RepID=UPI00026F4CC9|nr:dicarboxylate/amino acid:cation symporter [Pseudomonas sp. GM84]EJN39647.1 Na+/H+ dicarboxylate symporter [Pseudomonas sp. GM84]